MSKTGVTEQTRLFARRLSDALVGNNPPHNEEVAKVLAEFRDVILLCAIVKVEQEFNVKPRRKP